MDSKHEQVFVGAFVIVAAALLVYTVFALSGAFAHSARTYHAYFPFAGGVERGTTVRYAGGPKVGRVESLRLDPQDSTRIDITLSVETDVPVKTDSHVRIMSISPLGDNHVEIMPGSAKAALAPVGSVLASDAYLDFNILAADIKKITPDAQELLHTLNERATELKETVARVNDLLSPENRSNLSATLAETRGLIHENRPEIKASLQRIDELIDRTEPLLDNFRTTSDEANKTLDHLDSIIGENREDIHKSVLELRRLLANANDLTSQLNSTFGANADNLDEILDNLRHATENLKEFTDIVKKRPYTLIRASNPKEHKTGEQK